MKILMILLALGKFILLAILFLFLIILLLLALPFKIKLKGSYMAGERDLEYSIIYAWVIPLERIAAKMSSLSARKKRPAVPSKKAKDKIPINSHDEVKIKKAVADEDLETKRAVEAASKALDNESVYKPLSSSEGEGNVDSIESFKEPKERSKRTVSEYLEFLQPVWQAKSLIFHALVEFLKLFHFKPIKLEGYFGLDDPADTAFLFSAIYASLPLMPFLNFQLEPIFEGSPTDLELSFSSQFSVLQILLAFVFNFYLRRLLVLLYRLYRSQNILSEPII